MASNQRPYPLFCCDEPLTDLKEVRVVSRRGSVAGRPLGDDDFWRTFQCPACGRTWLDSHFHHTGSGNDCGWVPQRMIESDESYKEPPRDTLCTVLRHTHYKTAETEYGCRFPTEAELSHSDTTSVG